MNDLETSSRKFLDSPAVVEIIDTLGDVGVHKDTAEAIVMAIYVQGWSDSAIITQQQAIKDLT